MTDNEVPVRIDPQMVFDAWVRLHEEPTPHEPPDIPAERDRISQISTKISCLETMSGPHHEENLAFARRFRELSLWRIFPLNDLPDNVILDIFRQGIFCSPENRQGSIMPIVYSSVCKRWRTLALDASWLWGFIGFPDHPPYALTNLFVERSRDAYLFIEINLCDKGFNWDDDSHWPTAQCMVERLSVLLPHIHRWRSFSCVADNYAPILGALSRLQDLAAPYLQLIEFKQQFDMLPLEFSARLIPSTIFRGSTPALQKLILHSIHISWSNASFVDLTVLELCFLSPEELPTVPEFWDLLCGSPNLRRLVLLYAGPLFDEAAARKLSPIRLHHLEELVLQGSPTGIATSTNALQYVIFILRMFTFGSTVHFLSIGGFPPHSDLLQAIPTLRNLSQIKQLVLSDIHFTTVEASRWLYEMPNIFHLAFQGKHTQGSVMEVLASGPIHQPHVPCPHLTTLTLCEVDLQVIPKAVHHRCLLNRPIRELIFDISLKEKTAALHSLQGTVQFSYEGSLSELDEETYSEGNPEESIGVE